MVDSPSIAMADTATMGVGVPSRFDPPAQPAGSPVSLLREEVELSKLSIERDKLKLELTQLEGGALSAAQLKERVKNDRKKSALELRRLQRENREAGEKGRLELRKLRSEARNTSWSQWFELGKVCVPAISILASVWVAFNSIHYQRDKDRSVEVSQQLVHFQDRITATSSDNQPDRIKQRNAIAAVRSLGKDAIPSLLANMDLGHGEEIWPALEAAILELNEQTSLREQIRRQVLSSIKYVALRPNIPHLKRHVALWRECLRQYETDDKLFFAHAKKLAENLADYLHQQIESNRTKFVDGADKQELLTTINKLR